MSMEPLASLDRSTLRERALVSLRSAIVSGQYRPGDHLSEVELATSLGVSRGTVREALRHLQQEGLVTAGNRGMLRVNSLTPTATDPSESSERAQRWGRAAIDLSASKPIFEMYRSRIPMQKLPKPSDYGRAAAFIVSSEAEMMTGTDLRIDAGAVARYWPWDPAPK